MRWLVIFTLIGCGGKDVCPSDLVQGVCVELNNHPISRDDISWVLKTTTDLTTDRLGYAGKVKAGFEDNTINLTIIDDMTKYQTDGDTDIIYATWPDKYVKRVDMWVQYEDGCGMYKVMAHETLHTLQLFIDGLDRQITEGNTHDAPYFTGPDNIEGVVRATIDDRIGCPTL